MGEVKSEESVILLKGWYVIGDDDQCPGPSASTVLVVKENEIAAPFDQRVSLGMGNVAKEVNFRNKFGNLFQKS